MLSIKRTRELIKGSGRYPAEEIEEILDDMRALVEIIFESWEEKVLKNKENKKAPDHPFEK